MTRLRSEDRGIVTAEFAVCTVAAVAIGTVLLMVVRGGAVAAALTRIITSALNVV